MSKILLVEDDQNLSEIYQARLAAEGYEIVSAPNGEDALAVASQEKPDLVISDVMMPRVSGFEMLDILRHTDGMQTVKVIMLTALGQDNDRSKASELGADRYLVKSQVTLEDIVSAAKELLGDAEPAPEAAAAPSAEPTASEPPASQPQPLAAEPAASAPEPVATQEAIASTVTSSPSDTAIPNNDSSSQPSPATPPASDDSVGSSPASEDASAPASPASNPPVDNNLSEPSLATPPADNDQTASQPVASDSPDETVAEASQAASEAATPLAKEEAELAQRLQSGSLTSEEPTATPAAEPVASTEQAPATEPAASEPTPASAPTGDNSVNSTGKQPVASPTSAPVPDTSDVSAEPQASNPSETSTEPAAQSDASAEASNHDEVLAAALKELEGEQPPTPSADASASAASQPPKPEEAPASEAKPEPPNNQAVSGRKIIQPPEASEKSDINDLLAKEEASNPGQNPSPSDEPAHDPNDPGNIAL